MVLVDQVALTCVVFLVFTTVITKTWTVDEAGDNVIMATVVVWVASIAVLLGCTLYRIWA